MSRMYILVRKDLPKTWIPVQASHAVAEYLMWAEEEKKVNGWGNGVMVILAVENESDLNWWYDQLSQLDKDTDRFMESYPKPHYTALACILDKEQKNILKDLELIS